MRTQEEKDYLKEMGAKIRIIRKEQGISLATLEGMTTLNRVSLARLERGLKSSRVLTLLEIAKALHVDVKDFL